MPGGFQPVIHLHTTTDETFEVITGQLTYVLNSETKAIGPGEKIIFPKDPKAGGTWYAIDEFGTILVLLNGADEKHKVQLPYRKSRGLIVLDIISSGSPKDFWQRPRTGLAPTAG